MSAEEYIQPYEFGHLPYQDYMEMVDLQMEPGPQGPGRSWLGGHRRGQADYFTRLANSFKREEVGKYVLTRPSKDARIPVLYLTDPSKGAGYWWSADASLAYVCGTRKLATALLRKYGKGEIRVRRIDASMARCKASGAADRTPETTDQQMSRLRGILEKTGRSRKTGKRKSRGQK